MISVCKNVEELLPLYAVVDGSAKWGIHWENSKAVPKGWHAQLYVDGGVGMGSEWQQLWSFVLSVNNFSN